MPTDSNKDQYLIEQTICDIQEAIEKLMLDRELIENEISEKEHRIKTWRARLAGMGVLPAERKTRQKKGQNFRTIITLLSGRESPETGVSAAELVHQSGLPPSSVRAILQKEGSPFEEANGVWFIRRSNGSAQGADAES